MIQRMGSRAAETVVVAAPVVERLEARELLSTVVVGRYLFYNHSLFDGNFTRPEARDDDAIATDKQALLPGQTASPSNYSGYTRGINGVMIDLSGLPATATLAAADFGLKAGTTADPAGWAAAPAPLAVALRRGAGVGGSDRVTLVWSDGAIVAKWLEVTLLSDARTGVLAPDTFYFGNLPGEVGDSTLAIRVNSSDLGAVKSALNRPAPITSRVDPNRDGRVNALDLGAAKANLNRSLPVLAPAPDDPVKFFLDLNRNHILDPGELAPEQVDLGVIERDPVQFWIINTGSAPAVLDGEFVILEPDQSLGAGPGLALRLRPDVPQNVILNVETRDRLRPNGVVAHDQYYTFRSVADPSQPKVLAPGEMIQLELASTGISGVTAGSGSPTRRGRKLRFTGYAL